MAVVHRSSTPPGSKSIEEKLAQFPGPYIGYIKNSADVLRMGRLDVWIPELHGTYDESALSSLSQTATVRYCSPFAGQTPLSDTNASTDEYKNTQKSYGFWMVPPDIDTAVLVIFANGDRNNGFWIGCVPEPYMNHMTPGKASSSSYLGTEEQLTQYKDELKLTKVPVAEGNRKALKQKDGPIVQNSTYEKDIAISNRPLNPYDTSSLIGQGLEADDIRGLTTASARRETPSQVFGISTPGPIDFEGQQIGVRESINRHGRIFSGGGPAPGNTLAKVAHSRLGGHTFVMDDGTPAKKVNQTVTEPIKDELIRLRTRSGAQLLLHNTEGLVYITNTEGTSWIEFSKDGKIDIYSQDSVSVHTENDFNLRAERDLNLEAGRNINVKATGQNNATDGLVNSLDTASTGNIHFDASSDVNVISGGAINHKAGTNFQLYATTNGNIEVGADVKVFAGNDFLVNTGNEIHMNTSGKVSADHVGSSVVSAITTYTTKGINGTVSSLKRVPTTEPYPEHENKRRDKSTPDMTDVQRLDEREIS
jgi:hypothetical protein